MLALCNGFAKSPYTETCMAAGQTNPYLPLTERVATATLRAWANSVCRDARRARKSVAAGMIRGEPRQKRKEPVQWYAFATSLDN